MFDSYYDPPEQPDFCPVCFRCSDDCICPECLVCGEYGSPDCYVLHSLTISPLQIEAKRKHIEVLNFENNQRANDAYWDDFDKKANLDVMELGGIE